MNVYSIKKVNKYVILTILFVMLLLTFKVYVKADEITKSDNLKPQDVDIVKTTTNEIRKEGIFDAKLTNGLYKFSNDESLGYIPFIRYSNDRIVVDKEIFTNGIMFAKKPIEVNSQTYGSQVLFSLESVRVNEKMQRPLILSGGNVVIDSTIDSSCIILSTETVTITPKGKINGNLICFSKTLDLKGNVLGSVLGNTFATNISGKILKDLRLNTNTLDILSKDNISNQIYIETYNKDLNIKDKYPNASIKVLKTANNTITSPTVILSGVTNCLLFTLLYLFVGKLSHRTYFENLKIKTKKYIMFTVLSGSALLLMIPMVVLISSILSLVGLSVIAIPILLIYLCLIISIVMLSVFIVGSTLFTYTKQKYFKKASFATEILGGFTTFASLYILTKLPFFGTYISIALSILAIGMICTSLFKKIDNKVIKTESINK
ncbi:MAG: hypothetical protein RSB76_00930 [Clostridia bacterium]